MTIADVTEAWSEEPDTASTATALNETDPAPGCALRVRGLVQGVGFRPTVWRLANDCGLSGDVGNDADGVLIRIWGTPAAQQLFIHRLHHESPPLARIDALEPTPLAYPSSETEFRIISSVSGAVHTSVTPDAATCRHCLSEVLDRRNRRYGYAFNNCTHCGPRLSIVHRIPYDRANTSMAEFALCPACRLEYDDPSNRRFHAQPIACPDCGPRLWLEPTGNTTIDISGTPIAAAQRLLQAGHIVAIKGIGGFHLACDARNSQAVDRLRQRKRRYHKPFAVLAGNEQMVRRYCKLSEPEARVLQGPAAPIVLLDTNGRERLADGVAPGLSCCGVLLPYSPLHHLMMAGLDGPIVLTSGNRSGEPQCIDNEDARQHLADIADALLLNNRAIVNRLDDSVVRWVARSPMVLRRARGFAPAPLRLPGGFAEAPAILAFGGESKNTLGLLHDGEVILSQHLGDLENAKANAAYHQTLALYLNLFEHHPQRLAIDPHPDYLSSQLGRDWAVSHNLPLVEVQHHHAHIAACLVDNGIELNTEPVLGIALDGSGYGADGTVWGGEFLLADYAKAQRLATFVPVAMPGGAQAIHQPWRMAYAHLRRLADWADLAKECGELPYFRALADKPLATLDRMMATGFNCPLTSSCGRLFDAVAAVTGLCQSASYEGQPAIELEAVVHQHALADGRSYPFALTVDTQLPQLDPAPMWQALLQDLRAGVATGVIAARFHAGLAQALARMVDHLMSQAGGNGWGDTGSGRVALSGGVFQNAILSSALIRALESRGLQVLRHTQVPANDGGLSLGQAAVAAAQAMFNSEGDRPCV